MRAGGMVLMCCNLLSKLHAKKKISMSLLCLYAVSSICIVVWFLIAPFIRYGLSFLIILPLIAVAEWYDSMKKGLYGLMSGILVFALFLCLGPFVDNYVTDAGVFVKHTYQEPYYLIQKEYDDADTVSNDLNGVTVYSCNEGEINSYYYTPNTCYPFMLERTDLAGDSIQDGFVPK